MSDVMKKDVWDTCNSMLITWILINVSETIKKSIWNQLEQRFLVTNGERKYSLNKQIYSTKQGGRAVSEYYTDLRMLWEELQALTVMPPLTEMNAGVAAYVEALQCHQEEQRLLQFLSGMDEVFSHQRSQMLLMTKLPQVEEACKIIQQEESQREIFTVKSEDTSGLAMNSRKNENSCSNCGKSGHNSEQCWNCRLLALKGFPPGYDKGKNKFSGDGLGNRREKQKEHNDEGSKNAPRWSKGKTSGKKIAANAKVSYQEGADSNHSGSVISAK
ncbi:hypothetical protein RDABS01_038402 [Bienertia sinuspersici]